MLTNKKVYCRVKFFILERKTVDIPVRFTKILLGKYNGKEMPRNIIQAESLSPELIDGVANIANRDCDEYIVQIAQEIANDEPHFYNYLKEWSKVVSTDFFPNKKDNVKRCQLFNDFVFVGVLFWKCKKIQNECLDCEKLDI